MPQPFWFRIKVGREKIVVVDCGYVSEQAARDRVDRLLAAGIGRKNIHVELSPGRLFVEIPPKKMAVLETLGIVEGEMFWGSTHHFRETEKAKT